METHQHQKMPTRTQLDKKEPAMRRDTILFDINETVLDLSSLKPLFAKHLGSEAVTAT